MTEDLAKLHDALLDLTGLINQPQPDALMIREAGVELDRALMSLLVRVARRGPLGVGELAGMVGRDYTTVSRQVAKLESLGLVERRPGKPDRRVTEAVVSEQGLVMTAELDRARVRIYERLLGGWSNEDRRLLADLLRRFADDAMYWAREAGGGDR
jgi:DNA-binding MarR family transcriptional regulator